MFLWLVDFFEFQTIFQWRQVIHADKVAEKIGLMTNIDRRIGFNSCYHLTDVPAFITGRSLVFFDPHLEILPVGAMNPGIKIDSCNSDALQKFPDTCRPFLGFGCTMEEPYSGTLFRFALRSPEQAKKSRLSTQVRLLPTSHRVQFQSFSFIAKLLKPFLDE